MTGGGVKRVQIFVFSEKINSEFLKSESQSQCFVVLQVAYGSFPQETEMWTVMPDVFDLSSWLIQIPLPGLIVCFQECACCYVVPPVYDWYTTQDMAESWQDELYRTKNSTHFHNPVSPVQSRESTRLRRWRQKLHFSFFPGRVPSVLNRQTTVRAWRKIHLKYVCVCVCSSF